MTTQNQLFADNKTTLELRTNKPIKPTSIYDTLSTGTLDVPDRILLYGPEGIGKSTWAASAPAPIFFATEDGTNHLDVARLRIQKISELYEAIESLPPKFKTVIIDTVDWLQPVVDDYVCHQHGWTDIEAPGYGRGPAAALVVWRGILSRLESLRPRGIGLIMIGHSQITKYQNPVGEAYDRYQLKLQSKVSAAIKEWVDALFFANHEIDVKKIGAKGPKQHTIGISSGRVIHTMHDAAWDAKNRFGLPDEMPLDYSKFFELRRAKR